MSPRVTLTWSRKSKTTSRQPGLTLRTGRSKASWKPRKKSQPRRTRTDLARPHAPETGMRQARVRRRLHPGARPIAHAVKIAAQIRPTALHSLHHTRFIWVKAFVRPRGVFARTIRVIIRHVPVRAPLPHVARHVIESVTVRRKRFHGRGAAKAIGLRVLVRELSLPDIRLPLAIGHLLVSPHVRL